MRLPAGRILRNQQPPKCVGQVHADIGKRGRDYAGCNSATKIDQACGMGDGRRRLNSLGDPVAQLGSERRWQMVEEREMSG